MRLKPKIALLITPIILIQVMALVIPSFVLYKENFTERIKAHINDSLVQIEHTLNNQLRAVQVDSLLLSQSNSLNRYLRIENKQIRFNLMHRIVLEEFSSLMSAHPEYIEINLLSVNGDEEVSLLNQSITNRSAQEQQTAYFKNIVNAAADVATTVQINPDTEQWVWVLARKIFQKELIEQSQSSNKQLKGYLIIKINFDFMSDYIKHNSLLNNGFISLDNLNGDAILVNGNEALAPPVLIDNYKATRSEQLAITDWSLGKKQYIIGQKIIFNDLLCSIGWSKFALNTLLKEISTTSIESALLILVLSSAILLVALNKLLINPILRLNSSAKAMGEKKGKWLFNSNTKDEINDLANTIKEMGLGLIEQKEKVHKIAYIDALTQLPNRRQFNDNLQKIYQKDHHKLNEIALLFIDLDGFKQVNDSCGHDAGDQLLVVAAKRLQNVLRADNRINYRIRNASPTQYNIARLGGDEFTILLHNIRGRKAVEHIAKRIVHVLNTPINVAGRDFLIGGSIGIAIAAECGDNAVDLLKNADTAMYEAKKKGKNTYRFFNRNSALKSLKAMQIKDELRRAINNNELYLAYQPQVDARTGAIVSCEALIRWYQPNKGWIPPHLFIAIAEESELILSLGRWVLQEVCQHIKKWQVMGDPSVPVWINVSCVQLEREDMYQVIMDSLKEADISPTSIAVEVTESSIMQGTNSIIQLEKLRAAGIRIALDDFGTGYSSLSALRGLPIDKLKIDKLFIDDIKNGEDGQKIVSAIIEMGHHLNLKIVAEGVETAEELKFLREKKVDMIQGYYFSRPLLVDDFTESLRVSIRNTQPLA